MVPGVQDRAVRMMPPKDPGQSRRAARDRARQARAEDRKARDEARRGTMRDAPHKRRPGPRKR